MDISKITDCKWCNRTEGEHSLDNRCPDGHGTYEQILTMTNHTHPTTNEQMDEPKRWDLEKMYFQSLRPNGLSSAAIDHIRALYAHIDKLKAERSQLKADLEGANNGRTELGNMVQALKKEMELQKVYAQGLLLDFNSVRRQRDQLQSELANAESENLEQSRLLGASGSREAALLSELARLKQEREWRPISEAPRPSGKTVMPIWLGRRGEEGICIGGWEGPVNGYEHGWLSYDEDAPEWFEELGPDVYQPLPQPPGKDAV